MTPTNIEKAIKKNKPLLIKNFLDDIYKGEIKQLISELNKCNNLDYNPLIKSYYKCLDNYNFYKETKKELLKEKNFICNSESRIWRHKKDNLTKFHYDGNGINVVNICLHRRRFKLRQNNLKINYYNIITMNSKRSIMNCSCSSCFSLIRRVF
jgi:hypothetical protein